MTLLAPLPNGNLKTTFRSGREGGARQVRRKEKEEPSGPVVMVGFIERGRRAREADEPVRRDLEVPPKAKRMRVKVPSAIRACKIQSHKRKEPNSGDLRGTKETTLSLFHRPYLTLEWKEQSSSCVGSVKDKFKSGIPLSLDLQVTSPFTEPVIAFPDLSRRKSSVSVMSKSVCRSR